MSEQDIPGQLAALEGVVSRHDGFVVEEAARIRQDLSVPSFDGLRQHLEALAEEKRLLTIGIIGRVKAGKSSLLNSVLFDGQDILPKAATPMTASLVVISHDEKFSATVDFFSRTDIENIEKEHRIYCDELERRIRELTQEHEAAARRLQPGTGGLTAKSPLGKATEGSKEKAQRQAQREFKEHRYSASYDQYERMRGSGKLANMERSSATERTLTAESLRDLKNQLGEYVGSSGAFMPFTKSVHLKLPDAPRDVQVVDTPGVNDPVVSREQRTREYLKKCDVVLIVSPAGQFLSREDTDLMDNVTEREGIREMYVVAAQADTQLHGDVLDTSKGELPKALGSLRNLLGGQAVSTLSALKKGSPEVGKAYDQLIEGGEKRVIVTSSICYAMLQRFDTRSEWDDGMNHVWGLLRKNYQDYFGSDAGARETLKLLANIDSVQQGIEAARKSRDAIVENKRADYLSAQARAVQEFRNRLAKGIAAQVEVVRNTNLSQVEEQKQSVGNLLRDGGDAVDDAFEESLDNFKSQLLETVQSKSADLFAEAKSENRSAVKTESGRREKSGLLSGAARFFGLGGYEDYSYTTIRAGAVTARINGLVDDLQDELTSAVESAKREWKSKVQRVVVGELQNAVGDDAGQFFSMIKRALRSSVNSMQLPDMEIGCPFTNAQSGVLKGDDAVESFLADVDSYMGELRTRFRAQTREFIDNTARAAGERKMSDLIFSDLRQQLDTLENDVKDKQRTLDTLNRCIAELNSLGAMQ
jgi:tRNA U34 5-carboxymethylaminomethyl modifying GTPase MnmE/TrmE